MDKTIEEIEALKTSWNNDPCWDIETTEGFEAHHDELLAFRKKQELKWDRKAEEAISHRANVVRVETGITDSDIQQTIFTFREIENDIQNAVKRTESDSDVLASSQVRATLLLAAQVARIADALENMDDGDSLERSARIWGSD